MSNKKDYVFISFSKRETAKVATVITSIINSIYPKIKTTVEVFFSPEKLKAGSFRGQILDAMRDARFAITILSPENNESAWLMYEAGALSLAVEQNGGHLMPYLFCRHGDEVESTIEDLQYAQYQRDSENNQKELVNLITNLNNSLSKDNRVDDLTIKDEINKFWETINKKFENSAYNLYNPSASSTNTKSLDSKSNDSISISPIEGNFETDLQSHIRLADYFVPKKPVEIEEKFEMMLRTQIPRKWIQRNEVDEKFNATRVVVNGTRFSTFVVFTDGARVILFDRERDSINTNVTNDRFDVFGSVQFENRTIKNKIKNKKFFQANILKVEEISGAAIEDNRLKIGTERETAVMFGACIYLSPEDLNLAEEGADKGEIVIYNLATVHKIKEELLTSKATLGVNHITKNNIIT